MTKSIIFFALAIISGIAGFNLMHSCVGPNALWIAFASLLLLVIAAIFYFAGCESLPLDDKTKDRIVKALTDDDYE